MGDIVDATEKAIKAASHLTDADAGALETLRALALAIDEREKRWEALVDDAAEHQLRPPPQDNVSIPTYLKFCESLGLTPAGRAKLGEKKPEAPRGKLALLQDGAAGARKKTG